MENMAHLALIAHDAKKEEMVQLVRRYQARLNSMTLAATRGTGQMIMSRIGLPVSLVASGPQGGDQQIGGLVAAGVVKAVVFLRDPLAAHPHEPDVSALLRICDVQKIPVATNLAMAEALLHYLLEHSPNLQASQLATV